MRCWTASDGTLRDTDHRSFVLPTTPAFVRRKRALCYPLANRPVLSVFSFSIDMIEAYSHRGSWSTPGAFIVTLGLATLLTACATPNPRQQNLPPSETDLVLLKPGTLCGQKNGFLQAHPPSTLTTKAWGTGQEFMIPADRSPSHGDESYFFDDDGTLVGTLFTFASGLDLEPYAVLRHTLTLLKPTLEFYLTVANFAGKANMDSSSLYETGDEKTTTQYLVIS